MAQPQAQPQPVFKSRAPSSRSRDSSASRQAKPWRSSARHEQIVAEQKAPAIP